MSRLSLLIVPLMAGVHSMCAHTQVVRPCFTPCLSWVRDHVGFCFFRPFSLPHRMPPLMWRAIDRPPRPRGATRKKEGAPLRSTHMLHDTRCNVVHDAQCKQNRLWAPAQAGAQVSVRRRSSCGEMGLIHIPACVCAVCAVY